MQNPAHTGAVACGHPATADAAIQILEAGGNAFDAAIAAQFAACVAEPVLASLAGGGFLLARPAAGQARLLDFFAHTPHAHLGNPDACYVEVDLDSSEGQGEIIWHRVPYERDATAQKIRDTGQLDERLAARLVEGR